MTSLIVKKLEIIGKVDTILLFSAFNPAETIFYAASRLSERKKATGKVT